MRLGAVASAQDFQSLVGVAQTLADCATPERTTEDQARDKAEYRAKLHEHRESARKLARFHRMMADKYDAQVRHQTELIYALDKGVLL